MVVLQLWYLVKSFKIAKFNSNINFLATGETSARRIVNTAALLANKRSTKCCFPVGTRKTPEIWPSNISK